MTGADVKTMRLEQLLKMGAFSCDCGKVHKCGTKRVILESGAIKKLPALLQECGAKKPFLLSGNASFAAAGAQVCSVLENTKIPYSRYVFPRSPVLPTEQSVGSAVMHFDTSCDCIVGIGSGVINDIGKILAHISGKPYIIVGTAPSMDGYASDSSSMERDGLKVSLPSTPAWAIVGDLDILCNAPMHMIRAGVGDMVAKYVSLCEWNIARILIGEYYCPVVAQMIGSTLERCVKFEKGLLNREPEAVKAIMEGMILTGIAMSYAGVTRPASGVEHYFSHIWDMRGLAFGTKTDLHGIQCGIGTLLTLKIYDYMRTIRPNKEKALAAAAAFDREAWYDQMRRFIGEGAEAMIRVGEQEGKYDLKSHEKRLSVIIDKWDEILAEIKKLPTYEQLHTFMTNVGAPTTPEGFGVTREQVRETFTMTKDIRDKYVASRLLWDIGELESAIEVL